MKKVKLLTASVICTVLISSAAHSQIINTTTDGMSSGQIMQNVYMDNARRVTMPGGFSGAAGNAAVKAEFERVSRAGEAKIRAGKASTQFVASVAGTEGLAKSLSWDADDPQDVPGQVKYIQRYVRQFEILMRQNGYTPKDFADGYAFAYALSYAAYNNKDMEDSKVQQLRDQRRENLLKTAVFQGSPDTVKQFHYESNALMAMQAAKWRFKYRQATTAAERKEAEEKARKNAVAVIGKQS